MMFRLARVCHRPSQLPLHQLPRGARTTAQLCSVSLSGGHPAAAFSASGGSAALRCPCRLLHTSPHVRATPPRPPASPPTAASAAASSGKQSPGAAPALPSIDPVLEELQCIITRRHMVADIARMLTPASRKILVAHRLPVQELLLYLPRNFALFRERVSLKRVSSAPVQVCPPHLLGNYVQIFPQPIDGKPPQNVVSALGAEVAAAALLLAPSQATKGSGGFTDSQSLPQQRVEEVLTYVPNEWTLFSELQMPLEVKQRCMGYPHTRPYEYFKRYPQYFETRLQSHYGHSFAVRRSAALQQALQQAVSTPNRTKK